MAEPLKSRYGAEIPQRIASMIREVHASFPVESFLADALDGYEALELLSRGRKIAASLRRFLPPDYVEAVDVLLASLGPPGGSAQGEGGMLSFLYLPHTEFVGRFGLEHFDVSMRAQYELTQRFTAEFSIRPFLERHTQATLDVLERWAQDDSEHVRRLVSEGTRPRLPWAPRLRRFQRDPAPVLALLEKLKDDSSLYVRRSVANNLNDIGKDHPDLLIATARRWQRGAGEGRRWLVRHALRSAVKRGDAEALAVLGYGGAPDIAIEDVRITPARVREGERVAVSLTLHNRSEHRQALLADLCVHYVKANGSARPKVFKLKRLLLAPGDRCPLAKVVSLAAMSTRRHYPGEHRVELLLNGQTFPLGRFVLD